MRKVNEEMLLADYDELIKKQDSAIARVEEEARAFAINRGYDEAKTEEFVKYVLGIENGGLSESDKAILATFEKYIVIYDDEKVETVENGEPETVIY